MKDIPAFPLQDWDPCIQSPRRDTGMTLRDYFAAKAMQGMLAASENYQTHELAMYAYDVADAMLTAREAK